MLSATQYELIKYIDNFIQNNLQLMDTSSKQKNWTN